MKKPPPPKGEQPYVPPAARALAELKRGAAAFDEHQRRMARETTARGPFVAKETRPSRVREEAAPINPQRIPTVDNTPTAATCFDRFAREPRAGGPKWAD